MKASNSALRVITVALLSLFFCVAYYPDLVRVAGHPNGELGLRTDDLGVVTTVQPNSPAQRAGIRPGEALDLSALPAMVRSEIVGGFLTSPGASVTVSVREGGRFRAVHLIAVAESNGIAIVIRDVVFTVPLLIGIVLVLLRPSPITWGFFLFSLAAGGQPPNSVFPFRLNPPVAWFEAWNSLFALVDFMLPKTGLVLFAFSLARRPLSLWPKIAIALTAAIGVTESVPQFLDPTLNEGWPLLTAAGDILAAVIALFGLGYAYANVATRLRQRLHWITAGFILWIAVDVLDTLLWPTYESYWTHTAIDAAQIIFPLTVAYAIFRERVIDINFVLSRTLVYGLLTTAIVAVFALIDLFLSRTMEARFSLPVDIVVALLLGFFFHGMRKRIDATIDRVIFRKRHVAEMRLARAAKAVVHVDDAAAIADYLTRLPAEVLELTGACLYMRHGRDFRLEQCTGWKHEPPATISTSDPLVAFISAELGSVRVGDVPMHSMPDDRHDAPALAIPLVFRRELAGFALYGTHEDGADLDADDERALVPLVNNAAITYDHIEAQALRDEIRALRSLRPAVS